MDATSNIDVKEIAITFTIVLTAGFIATVGGVLLVQKVIIPAMNKAAEKKKEDKKV